MKLTATLLASLVAGSSAASLSFLDAIPSVQQSVQQVLGFLGQTPEIPKVSDMVDEFGASVQRLIQVNDEQVVLFESDYEIQELVRAGIKFMDVTDHYEFYSKLELGVSNNNHHNDHQNRLGHHGDHGKFITFPRNVSYPHKVNKLIPSLSKTNLEQNLKNFSSFHTRYYKSQNGLESSLWLFELIKKVARPNPSVRVFPFNHKWAQKSVIAKIPGSARHPDTVIISAHLDSTNLILPNILPAPGADDNGSGTVTILEVFRVLIESGYKPYNNLEFHWYSAEEGGLLGSQDILTEYKKRHIPVVAQFQQDMTGYVKDPENEVFGVITDYVSPALTNYVELIIDTYADIGYVEDVCGYACSDHASGTKVGFPSAFVIENAFKDINPYIHTVRDTVDKLSFDHMIEHAKLTLGFAYELGLYQF